MADEVPIEGAEIRQLRLLARGLLEATLPETALPQLGELANRGGGLPLAHRQQAAGRRQLGADGLQAGCR